MEQFIFIKYYMSEVVDMTSTSRQSWLDQSKLYLKLSNVLVQFRLDSRNLLQWCEYIEVVLTYNIAEEKEEEAIIKTWLWSTMAPEIFIYSHGERNLRESQQRLLKET